jgi:multiple sugar transport system substrate-binding protein
MTERDDDSEGIFAKKMTRRRALSTSAKMGAAVVGTAIVAGGVGFLGGASSAPAPSKVGGGAQTITETQTQTVTASATASQAAGATNVNFTVWQYNVAEIKDNISKFQALHPNITVTEFDDPWPQWPGVMVKRFTSNTPVDVTYDGEDWLAQWAAGGWVVPLEDYWDKYATLYKFKSYVSEMVPFAKQSMTYNGKIYGLPYYSDMFTFMYNAKVLSDNGLDVPKDWNEVRDVSMKLKQKGVMQYPYILEMQAGGGGSFDFYIQLTAAYGDGARLFDENLNPLFNDPASPFYKFLQWLVDGLHKDQFITPDYLQNHETVVAQKLGAGQGALTVMAKYNLAAANTPGSSPLAGQFRMALMPGKTHEAYGFAKMYNLTKSAVGRGDSAVQSAISFIEYFGGSKGPVLKRWAVQDGLGFGFLSPYGDPDVNAALNTLYGPGASDVIKQQAALALTEPHPVWFGDWIQYCYTTAIPNALSQQISVADAVKGMADKLKEVKSG